MPKLRVTLKKSPIGHHIRQERTLHAMGLRRLGRTVELTDNESVRGMIKRVAHLVDSEEVADDEAG